jgi:hypothetical protein
MASQHSSHPDAPRGRRRRRGRLAAGAALAGALLVTAVHGGGARAAETMVHPGPPTVDGAEEALDSATTSKSDAMARRSQLQADLASTRQEISALGLQQVALIHELEVARHRVRVVTVRAYTNANGGNLDLLMDAGDIGDHLFRTELLAGNVVDTRQAIDDYHDLQAQADDQAISLAEAVDDIQAGIEDAGRDITAANRDITRAQVELSAARAAVAQNASGHTDPGEGAWERLRFCESGGVYTTNTGNGFYGAYQFDLQTWRSMGGDGRPSDATYWEQDIRAKALFWARGAQPWPVCGRFLG